MNLIGRYIFRQTLVSTAVVMAVLLVIFMSNEFAQTLGDAAADLLPREAVFRVFALQFIQYLALLAPIGLLLGILLALARLNRDSEMAAMAACGIGPGKLLKPMMLLGLGLAIGVGWLALVQAPAAARAVEDIRFQARERMEIGVFEPGGFTTIDSGSTVLYARESDGNRLQGVFVYSENGGGARTVVAAEGERTVTEADELRLSLTDGAIYRGRPGEGGFAVTEFGSIELPISLKENEREEAIAGRPTLDLIAAGDAESRAELEWRLAGPVSIVILGLLAVSLGRSSPREGKYARVGIGLLLYITYANGLSVARVWLEREWMPAWVGIWWVHAAAALLALLLLLRQSGVLLKPKIRDESTR